LPSSRSSWPGRSPCERHEARTARPDIVGDYAINHGNAALYRLADARTMDAPLAILGFDIVSIRL